MINFLIGLNGKLFLGVPILKPITISPEPVLVNKFSAV